MNLLRHIAFPAALALGLATPALADPALWKVSDADSSIYLFGSMHAFTRPVEWRTETFDHLLETADHVYFEVIMNVEAYSTITLKTMTDGRITDGRTIADLLTPEQYQRFETAVLLLGSQTAIFERMKPWLANMTLAAAAMPGATAGVETQVESEVSEDRERGLETAEEQMAFLSSPSIEDQVTELMSTVDGINSGVGLDLEPMIAAWESGDTAALDAAMTSYMSPADKPLYERLITKRNERWVDTLTKLLADNDQSLVIVGAGHLVGAGGVPALLYDAGYTVERIDDATDSAPAPATRTLKHR